MTSESATMIAHPKEGDLVSYLDLGVTTGAHRHYRWTRCSKCGNFWWMNVIKKRKRTVCLDCLYPNAHLLRDQNRSIVEIIANPCVRDIVPGSALPRSYDDNHFFIWVVCVSCGTANWVRRKQNTCVSTYKCRGCAQQGMHRMIIGGREYSVFPSGDGYLVTYLRKTDPYFPMATARGAVRVHRLVMATRLGRCLKPWEVVHHIDGDRSNDQDSNLELTKREDHASYNLLQGEVYRLREQVGMLQQKVKLAEWRIAELENQG